MKIIVNNKELPIISLLNAGKGEVQLVTECYKELIENLIMVFIDKDGQETLGVIKSYDDNEKHRILYIEINPNNKSINTKNIRSVLVWGSF